ncbi:unnamed protein product [Amoebophrya sp. A25]|nr:unnamed protein product [Amoebophrya sp. A25]|eukprot:GSA25T00003428001.1
MSCFAGAFCLWFFCLTLKTEMFICFKSEVLFERSSRLNHCCTEGGSTAVANLDPKTGQLQLLTTKASRSTTLLAAATHTFNRQSGNSFYRRTMGFCAPVKSVIKSRLQQLFQWRLVLVATLLVI